MNNEDWRLEYQGTYLYSVTLDDGTTAYVVADDIMDVFDASLFTEALCPEGEGREADSLVVKRLAEDDKIRVIWAGEEDPTEDETPQGGELDPEWNAIKATAAAWANHHADAAPMVLASDLWEE